MDHLDPTLDTARRVADLLDRMTLEEKAGQLFQTMALCRKGGSITDAADAIGIPAVADLIADHHLTHFNMLGADSVRGMATWHNDLQDAALATRLQIPISLSSDPRHGPGDNIGTGIATVAFSGWPEALGLAAIGDESLVEQFADIVRQEYLSVGIRVALHPQVDVATEPRWSRTWGTFGEDADTAGRLGAAYVRGLQGPRVGPSSVSAMVKHFPGNGPVEDGEDPHFAHGQRQVYPGANFDAHLAPFRAAVDAGAAQVMPSYGVPIGIGLEEVACGFNRDVVTGLLRGELGFDGVVCTDWGIITDSTFLGEPKAARAWGVEHLSPHQRIAKALDAGVDQFGGEHCPELVVELVARGDLAESRIDESVARLLHQKFTLGLFEHRHVDLDEAERRLAEPASRALGRATQSRSVTVLTNEAIAGSGHPALPLTKGCRVHLVGVDPEVAGRYATVVDDQPEADVTILRVTAPHEPRPGAFESFFHSGSLAFDDESLEELLQTLRAGPTVVDVFLERPAVVTPLVDEASALVATYGCTDEALLDALFGIVAPEGRLPVALPRSMAAVEASPTDVPLTADAVVFPRGAGLRI